MMVIDKPVNWVAPKFRPFKDKEFDWLLKEYGKEMSITAMMWLMMFLVGIGIALLHKYLRLAFWIVIVLIGLAVFALLLNIKDRYSRTFYLRQEIEYRSIGDTSWE